MLSELFSKDFHIVFYEAGADNRLTLPSMFNFIQELAYLHTASQKVGIDDLHQIGLTWVLSRIKLNMEYYPECNDVVTGYIWSADPQQLYVPRYFLFKSTQTGKTVATCSTYWLMLNLKTFIPAIPEESYHPIYSEDEQITPHFDHSLERIRSTPAMNPIEFHVEQYHIDANQHVNNRFYLAFAESWLARTLGRPVSIESVQINFNSALRFGDVVICTGEFKDERRFRVVGHTPDGQHVFSTVGTVV